MPLPPCRSRPRRNRTLPARSSVPPPFQCRRDRPLRLQGGGDLYRADLLLPAGWDRHPHQRHLPGHRRNGHDAPNVRSRSSARDGAENRAAQPKKFSPRKSASINLNSFYTVRLPSVRIPLSITWKRHRFRSIPISSRSYEPKSRILYRGGERINRIPSQHWHSSVKVKKDGF